MFRVCDLKLISDEGILDELGIKNFLDKKRIMGMIKGDPGIIENFQYLSKH